MPKMLVRLKKDKHTNSKNINRHLGIKENLDTRICDYYIEDNVTNEQTFREFIIEAENSFNIEHEYIDNMNDKQILEYIEFLDYLYDK